MGIPPDRWVRHAGGFLNEHRSLRTWWAWHAYCRKLGITPSPPPSDLRFTEVHHNDYPRRRRTWPVWTAFTIRAHLTILAAVITGARDVSPWADDTGSFTKIAAGWDL